MVNTVVDKVLLGDRQATIVIAAMVRQLDLNARNDSVRRQA
jgi:hypothetical protein